MKPIKTNQCMAGFVIAFETVIVACILVALWCLLGTTLSVLATILFNTILLNYSCTPGVGLLGCIV